MAEPKTKKSAASVAKFLNSVNNPERRKDAKVVLEMMKSISGKKPVMWGDAIVGFGSYHYVSDRSSQKGEWPLIAFSPRKEALTLYLMQGFGEYGTLLKKLGTHKKSKACLYIRHLDHVHLPTLKKLLERSYKDFIQTATDKNWEVSA